ncbi:DEAD/DEAH box helicase family protein [Campylobacter jejuni]|nr:DEAD/DEAH box helicase family protein [Campylobacter jejuni]
MNFSEQDTRVKIIDEKLKLALWNEENIIREYYFNAGKKLIGGKRGQRKFVDYLLKFQNKHLAIIEAKKLSKDPLDGLSQAQEYAKNLDVRFVYCTNGEKIYEYDMQNARGEYVQNFASPQVLFERVFGNLKEWQHKLLTQKDLFIPQKELRYYQKIAVERVIKALIEQKDRILLTLATGTGKTTIAFALCYRLLEARWNKNNKDKKPRILFLSDRVSLRDQALGEFNYIEQDCKKIDTKELKKSFTLPSANVYFGIYQSLSAESDINDEENKFYLLFPKDFFDLVIIDECHRGGANEEGSWKEVLEHFSCATHLGLTATPKQKDNVDTYKYFGESVYEYSLKDGIEDGFLTPYKVKLVTTSLSGGYTYNPDDIIEGKLEKGHFDIKEFERNISIPQYNEFIAKELLKLINLMDKTIIFCVNQAHASEIKRAIDKHKSIKHNDYCVRVTSNEGIIGLNYLKSFQDNDKAFPVILTSSKMLTTGVDARNVRNIVLLANIGSMIEFKQIIGRGTRVYEGKDFFTIIDFVGATKLFYDPKWDGQRILEDNEDNKEQKGEESKKENNKNENESKIKKKEKITVHIKGTKLAIYDIKTSYIGENDKPLDAKEFLEFLFGKLAKYYQNEAKLREIWSDLNTRKEFLKKLENDGISKDSLQDLALMFEKDCDLYDVLAHLSFNTELKTRKERVQNVKNSSFLKSFHNEKALRLMNFLLDKYENVGIEEFEKGLKPLIELSSLGNIKELSIEFGGINELMQSFATLQRELYAG